MWISPDRRMLFLGLIDRSLLPRRRARRDHANAEAAQCEGDHQDPALQAGSVQDVSLFSHRRMLLIDEQFVARIEERALRFETRYPMLDLVLLGVPLVPVEPENGHCEPGYDPKCVASNTTAAAVQAGDRRTTPPANPARGSG